MAVQLFQMGIASIVVDRKCWGQVCKMKGWDFSALVSQFGEHVAFGAPQCLSLFEMKSV